MRPVGATQSVNVDVRISRQRTAILTRCAPTAPSRRPVHRLNVVAPEAVAGRTP